MSSPAYSPDVYAAQSPATVQGHWVVNAHAPHQAPLDVTYIRGIAVKINSWIWEDPFGPKQMSLTFPGVTIFDKIGQGELAWLQAGTNVDLLWTGSIPVFYPGGSFVWEGYFESFSWSKDGLQVDCKGALYQSDNYLAKPEYLARPLPYEYAIIRQLKFRDDLRTHAPQVIFPSWWTNTYSVKAGTPSYLQPVGVVAGQKWTGMVTRATGNWDQVLTSYIQTLLASMYTNRGRWTLDLFPGRVPTLMHRDYQMSLSAGHLLIDPASPGVDISISQDFGQSLNAVFGQGKSLTGISYSGQSPTPDGQDTHYLPLAQLRQVDNASKESWYDPAIMRREILLHLQEGLEEDDARAVAVNHLQHFTDPGLTGTITLAVDPTYVLSVVTNSKGTQEALATTTLSRMLIKSGMTIQIPGLLGSPEGHLFHITNVTASGDTDPTVSLTVDTKYRDALTVAEVKLRGRDSLSIQRQLIGGQYSPPIPDQLVPWNYSQGSGYIPSSPHLSSVPLFRGMPSTITFPWTEWTTQRPPSNKNWRNCYVRLVPKSSNADNNWASFPDRNQAYRGIPIKLAQAGSIRLLQIAAYDSSGNILPVPFHVSFYYYAGVSAQAMPQLRSGDTPNGGYAVGQHYPYFNLAWEQYNLDGTKITSEQPTTVSSAGLIRAYGTGIVKAGYWPGSQTTGDSPTGLLVDEGQVDFDTSQDEANINVYQKNQKNPLAGYVYMMIYCDAQASNEVFFAGRIFRVEPGGN